MTTPADVEWLTPDERAVWMAVVALTSAVAPSVEAQLGRDAGLSLFEYGVLAVLSAQDDRQLPMSGLAMVTGGSLSRLSHLARRMERRGYLVRSPLPGDGRVTVATLTDAGHAAVVAVAPAHVAEVRRLVVDPVPAADRAAFVDAALRIMRAVNPDAAAQLHRVLGRELPDAGA